MKSDGADGSVHLSVMNLLHFHPSNVLMLFISRVCKTAEHNVAINLKNVLFQLFYI